MDRLLLPGPWNAVLGRAGRLAHHARGKRGKRRRGQRGCLCFIWNCPPQATRGQPHLEAVWPLDACAHCTTACTQSIKSSSESAIHFLSLRSHLMSVFTCLLSLADVTEAYSRTPLAALSNGTVCLCYALSRVPVVAL